MLANVRIRSIVIGALTAVLLSVTLNVDLAAQSTATILGTVTDSSGAAVPDATVQARNAETGANQTATSDSAGRYRIADLAIGTYDVQSEKMGFQLVVHKGVELTVGGQIVADFSLPVGQLTQTVTVEGEVPTVETTSAALSNVVEPSQIRDLPLNGRNFEQLILLAPGVLTFQGVTRGLFYGVSNAFSVAGSRPNGQQMLLDDTDVMDYMNRGSGSGVLGTSMGVDAIAEFQTLTNTYGAQFGGNGGVINSVSKSGTNNFHGSAYEFLRNSALDARNFFDIPTIAPYKRNQFGGTLGGPIKKDKMFFFVNYEGLRQRLGETTAGSILDADARLGLTDTGASYCPAGGTCAGGQPAVQVVPGGGWVAANVAPYLRFYDANAPAATGNSFSGNNLLAYSMGVSQPGAENYVLARYDWTISLKDSAFVRYLGDLATVTEPLGGAFTLWPNDQRDHNQFATIEEKHIFSNNVINTAHFGFSRPLESLFTTASYPVFQQTYPGAGLPDPRLLVTGVTSPGLSGDFLGPNRQGPLELMQNKFAIGNDVLWVKGAHTLRLGASLTRIQGGTIQNSPGGGDWTFNNLTAFMQGNAYSILGPLSSIPVSCTTYGISTYNNFCTTSLLQIPGTNGHRDFREIDYAVYAQDDWKVKPNLTLNIGLRYEPTSNPYCLPTTTPYCTDIVPSPSSFGSVPGVQATQFSLVHNVFFNNPSLHNLDPRIGLAWAPFKDQKTSVRAGYGIFHSIIAMRDYEPEYDLTPPYALATQYSPPFPSPPSPTSCVAADFCDPVVQLGYNPYTNGTPYEQQWNLTIQREIFKNTTVSVAYVGSHGVKFSVARDLNPPIASIGADGNPVYASVQSVNGKPTVVSNPLINSNFGYVNESDNIGWQKYNSLQAGFIHRLTTGLQMQASYTYSKCTDQESGSWGLDAGTVIQSTFNPSAEDGWCGYDIRHNVYFNGMYDLPFHGNRAVTGWQLSGIFTYRTGVPINITDGFVDSYPNSSGATSRPNYTPNGTIVVNGATISCNNTPLFSDITNNPMTQAEKLASGNVYMINPACFAPGPLGEFGNLPRNFLHGPNTINLDSALMKNTKISERLNVQFRAEFFNVLNRTNFINPSGALFSWTTSAIPAGTVPTTGLSVSQSAGRLTSTGNNTSRQIQFGLKFQF